MKTRPIVQLDLQSTQTLVQLDYSFYNVLLKCLPKFYSIISFTGVSHSHLSDHMSELVENTISDLEQSKVSYSVICCMAFSIFCSKSNGLEPTDSTFQA
jgi:hypothetical protein